MANILTYAINPNLAGVNGFGAKPSTAIYNTQLAATTDKTLTVPSSAAIGIFADNSTPKFLAVFGYEAGKTVFVGNSTPTAQISTAAPDTSGTIVAASSVINPSALLVTAGDTLHFYATAQAFVSVAFYAVT